MTELFYITLAAAATALLLYACLMAYFMYGMKNEQYRCDPAYVPQTSISVIVPVRNEQEHIARCLNALIQQNYPAPLFEIIVADDHSEDRTEAIIAQLLPGSTNLRLLRLPESRQGKKEAIAYAIEQAAGALIVTTDGDCTAGPDWLRTIASFYERTHSRMILGPVVFLEDNSLLGKIQALEFAGLMAVTASAARLGRPFLCNGANLAYEKDVFLELDGFAGIQAIQSGDDVLFLHKVKERYPASVCALPGPDARVFTAPPPGLRAFFDQRMRWASKARYYTDKFSLLVSALVFSANFFPLMAILLAFTQPVETTLLACVILPGFKCLIDFLFLFLAARISAKTPLLAYFLPAQLFVMFYVSITGLLSGFMGYHWKGRSVK
ncbi:MAG: glycosyltransferase [Bacteroidota bacterium]